MIDISRTYVDSWGPRETIIQPQLVPFNTLIWPSQIRHLTLRVVANDYLLYRAIKSVQDQIDLQKYLDELQKWADIYGMIFNSLKCQIYNSIDLRKQFERFYIINK